MKVCATCDMEHCHHRQCCRDNEWHQPEVGDVVTCQNPYPIDGTHEMGILTIDYPTTVSWFYPVRMVQEVHMSHLKHYGRVNGGNVE